MGNSLTLPASGWKFCKTLRDESDERSYTYEDNNMRSFVRQSIKGGRCTTFNQYYKFKLADEIFRKISEELNEKGHICRVIEVYVKYISKEKN